MQISAAAEDAADSSYAGEHYSYLELHGPDAVADAVCRCWASLYTGRAVSYRGERDAGAMAVVVQRMVPARAAGVFMTLNPANGDRSTLVCEAVWGLGEPLVSGEVTPDRFVLDKVSGDVVRREIADKPTRLVRAPGGGTVSEDVPDPLRATPCLTDAELTELLRIGRAVERASGCPQDGEFAIDPDGVALLQARPETVWSQRAAESAQQHRARRRAGHPRRRHPRPPDPPRWETVMASDRFPSPFDIETPPGAEGWESMYDWYHLFGPERRELDEQRFWFADRLHHPDVLHPYDEIQCECWWQALGAFNTRIFAMPPAFGVDQRILNGRL